MLCVYRLSLACIALCALASCASHSINSPASQLDVRVRDSARTPIDTELDRSSKAIHNFLMGELSYIYEDFESALKYYEAASKLKSNPSPKVHARLAVLYMRASKLEEAEEDARKALALDPENESYQMLYAGILESLGRGIEAEPIYKNAIEKRPEELEPYLLLSNLYLASGRAAESVVLLKELLKRLPEDGAVHYYLARAQEGAGELVEAESNMRKAYQIRGGDARIAAEVIRIIIKQNNAEKVKRFCQEILKSDPDNSLARRILGQIAIDEGQLDAALDHLEALQANKDISTETHFKIALIHIEKQSFVEAERHLLLVLAGSPNNSMARYYLASIYAGSGRNKEAVEELMKIERGQEMYVKSRTFAAFILKQEGDFKHAEKAIRAALDENPEDLKNISYLTLILRGAGRYREARRVVESALKKTPDNEGLLFNYGVVLHDLGDTIEALEVMNRVININPQNAEALNFVAFAIAEQSVEEGAELERAEKLVKRALLERPADGYFLDTLGWIYYKQGKLDLAEEILARAVSLTTDDFVIIEHYADVLNALGRTSDAIQRYSLALEVAGQLQEKSTDQQEAIKRIVAKLKKLSIRYPTLNVEIPQM